MVFVLWLLLVVNTKQEPQKCGDYSWFPLVVVLTVHVGGYHLSLSLPVIPPVVVASRSHFVVVTSVLNN